MIIIVYGIQLNHFFRNILLKSSADNSEMSFKLMYAVACIFAMIGAPAFYFLFGLFGGVLGGTLMGLLGGSVGAFLAHCCSNCTRDRRRKGRLQNPNAVADIHNAAAQANTPAASPQH